MQHSVSKIYSCCFAESLASPHNCENQKWLQTLPNILRDKVNLTEDHWDWGSKGTVLGVCKPEYDPYKQHSRNMQILLFPDTREYTVYDAFHMKVKNRWNQTMVEKVRI